jgi:hypothetical protein
VLFARGRIAGGTRLTLEEARRMRRPCLRLDIARAAAAAERAGRELRLWLGENRIRVLNIAGPRESQVPGIEVAVAEFLVSALGRRDTPAGRR